MAELVDATDLKSVSLIESVGSSPSARTNKRKQMEQIHIKIRHRQIDKRLWVVESYDSVSGNIEQTLLISSNPKEVDRVRDEQILKHKHVKYFKKETK